MNESARAQYFGRNKVRYKNIDFKVLETPNFQFYHYFQNDSVARSLLKHSEKWYRMHQEVLKDTIRFKNPIIFYKNHADFQQTTAISGPISVGTGGVTEAFKNRVVMPVMESFAQTDHVLGHELVHAFQYNMLRDSKDSTLSLGNIRNLPLWLVEGMAEYMSIGRVDAHTAMWMRDAYLNNDIPSIKDLNTNPKYFPYRYGQAFWAFVAGTWGDDMIRPMFEATARYGLDGAIDTLFNVDQKTFSNMFKTSLENHYKKVIKDSTENLIGKKLLYDETSGKMNIAPVLSPDGNYIAFLSELNIFTIDLFLADARTGKVIRTISSTARNSHIDAFSFVESTGAWAPDSRRFAFVTFSKGQNKLIIVDAQRGKTLEEIFIPGVEAFSNPTWSPDGEGIVVSGLVEGQTDLYYYNLSTRQVTQLTNDPYSDIQPSWSPDGRFIAFASDREEFPYGKGYNLSLLNVDTKEIATTSFFPGAKNLNPVFTPDGSGILFLSNRDGFRNMYLYDLERENIYMMTDLITGISGITEYSPAINVGRKTNDVVYSYYNNNTYTIYRADLGEFLYAPVDPFDVDFTAATLPPFEPVGPVIVSENLLTPQLNINLNPDSVKQVPYKPQFKLDYIGNTGVGVSASRFGTGIAGGVSAIFSDILSNNQLYTSLAINGEIYDFGGQFAYLNQDSRINWGASISHIPYRYGFIEFEEEDIALRKSNGEDTLVTAQVLQYNIWRVFEEKLNLFAYYPISTTRRFEFGGAVAWYSNRIDQFNNFYYQGFRVGQEREKGDAPDGYSMQQLEAAFVGDNSYFGIASPLQGHRFRIGVEKYFGGLNFQSFLADYRKYIFFNPLSLGFRVYHYARYGEDADSRTGGRLSPLFIGFPTLIHGYENVEFRGDKDINPHTFSINQLLGSRILVTNVELRVPFTGPKQLSLIKSGFFFTELALFFDGGLAWDSNTKFDKIRFNAEDVNADDTTERAPVFSAGAALRINLFGQLIIEPYYAIPFQRQDVNFGVFGVNFSPGW